MFIFTMNSKSLEMIKESCQLYWDRLGWGEAKIHVDETEDQMLLYCEINQEVYGVKFDKESCVGFDSDVVAEAMMPLLLHAAMPCVPTLPVIL